MAQCVVLMPCAASGARQCGTASQNGYALAVTTDAPAQCPGFLLLTREEYQQTLQPSFWDALAPSQYLDLGWSLGSGLFLIFAAYALLKPQPSPGDSRDE